jgi:UDP-N-acetylglucosamine--N-acetylmuramyl-(pentapeptide) pyrophosphoryl-undecaprenol N-acetylglucosamine transferase
MEKELKVIISGGGTGGHVYPALAIADRIRLQFPDAKIRFIGAKGKMEMEKVPQYGYQIDGLWISGFQRKSIWKNILLPFKILSSFLKVNSIISDFKPNVVIGVGGYASGPLLYVASRRKIPALIQEQNSFPGITNKMLAPYAKKICVAYPGLERFFAKEKLVYTGNPVRDFSGVNSIPKNESLGYFNLKSDNPTLLIIGGSLGARTINQSILKNIEILAKENIQVIWQTGKLYFEDIKLQTEGKYPERLRIYPFIDRMDYAYSAADVVISRAGAISISELALAGKPVILVPSPNVAEDHQTKNAMSLVEADAAELVKDNEANGNLVPKALKLLKDATRSEKLASNIKKLAMADAAEKIVEEMIKILN